MNVCAKCKHILSTEGKVSRTSICPHCGSYLHSCVNCKFYSPGSHNDCREPQADYVSDKRSSNFCDYFLFRETNAPQDSSEGKYKKNAREQFNKLFGDKE